jgi:hypothetical protein
MSRRLGPIEDIREPIKDLHMKLINEKLPHIIAVLEGDSVHVVIAGKMEDRKQVLQAILANKDWQDLGK